MPFVCGVIQEEESNMIARVGKPAPDFEVSAFYNGTIQKISLTDYRKKWVVLFFYPADFTFV